MKLTAFVLFGFLAMTSLLSAEVPPLINYQGFVTDTNGGALGLGSPVNRKIVFRIYDDANAGNRLWTEEHTVTLVDGQFSILLGAGIDATGTAAGETRPSIDSVFAGSGERYIGLTVDNGDNTINESDTEIAPRQRITSTAFALRAQTADRVADNSDLYFTGDSNHGLGWYGSSRLFNGGNVNGPVLYGYDGGALGSVRGSAQTTALSWENDGDVSVSKDLSTVGLTTTGNVTVGGTFSVAGTSSFTGQAYFENGIKFGGFDPDPNYVGTTGNSLSFGHDGASEDFIGYKSNTFFFKDSPDGGDTAQPNVVVGGKLGVGVDNPNLALEVNGSMSTTGSATVTGNLNVSNNTTLNGTLNVAGGGAPQGLRLAWNLSGSQGESNILNWKGGGAGGINFGEFNGSTYTQTMAISPTGNVSAPGSLTSGTDLVAGGKVTANGKTAAVGEEQLKIIRGTVTGSENSLIINVGSGFVATKYRKNSNNAIDQYIYQIDFSEHFSGEPTITATYTQRGVTEGELDGDREFVTIFNPSTSGFLFRTTQDDGAGSKNSTVSFIAIGPR